MAISVRDIRTVPVSGNLLVFRDVSWRGLVWGGLIFGCVAAYAVIPGETLWSRGVAAIPGVTAFLLIALGGLQRWRTGNRWLLIAAQEGLYVNVGYCEGYPAPGETSQTLFIPREDVRAISRLTEVMRLPHRFGMTRHHLGCLDIAINRPLPDEASVLMAQHHEQLYRAGKSGPFPIRMASQKRLRLCWSAIRPDERSAMQQLSVYYPSAITHHIAYPEWDQLIGEQRHMFLDELWRAGMRSEALFLTRMHLGVSLKEAREFLEKGHATVPAQTE